MMNLADLRSDRFRGSTLKLPMCLMVSTVGKLKDTGFEATTPVLFIKSESLKLSSWVNNGSGKVYTHTFNGGVKDTGIAFAAPRMHFVATSPRLVEVTKKGFEAGIGRKGAIIGNYETPEGSVLREQEYPREYTTLRTLHMLFLLDENNQPLHKVPLVLSIHGGGAAILGKQLNLFYRQLEVVFSEHQNAQLVAEGQPEQFFTLNEEARAIAVFEPILNTVTVGEEQTSDIPAFASYKEPTIETVESVFNFHHCDKIWSAQKSLSNFASTYLNQFQQYHPVDNLSALQLTAAPQPETFDNEQVDFNFERRLRKLDYDPTDESGGHDIPGF